MDDLMASTSTPPLNNPTAVLRRLTAGIMLGLGRILGGLGIHPNTLTLLGFGGVIGVTILIAGGAFREAGFALILIAPLDALDGAVARATQRVSTFGALLDSTLDRIADGLLCAGLGIYCAGQGQLVGVMLAFAALMGAFSVSYVRARAEGLALGSIKDGFFDRVMRTLVFIAALLTGWIMVGLLILAIGTNLTALHRLWIAHQLAQESQS
ncbi:MAG: CDP-alcohol phosphatidyltransferase family protein [Anaerolineae bacterium]|nr:CDP-alcohol phosphatidyltransferase family protein [Anaerolineae bacterium]